MDINEKKMRGRKFTTMKSLNDELYKIWTDIELQTIRKIWICIYDKIHHWIDSEGKMVNY